MSDMILSPSEMKAFSIRLAQLAHGMEREQAHLEANIDWLGETWKDERHRAFLAKWADLRAELQIFYNRAQICSETLYQKAEYAQDYLDHG